MRKNSYDTGTCAKYASKSVMLYHSYKIMALKAKVRYSRRINHVEN